MTSRSSETTETTGTASTPARAPRPLREVPAPVFRPPDAIVIRYSEIFLKGENRRLFEDVLVHNLRRALRTDPELRVDRHHARLLVRGSSQPEALEVALRATLRVFGVSSASLVVTVPRDLEAIAAIGAGVLVEAARHGGRSFKVKSRRADKRFEPNSFVINDVVGAAARQATGLAVDVHAPDLTLVVEIGPELSFVTAHVERGPGGLPVGVSGDVSLLLSGGIDSPVAGWLCQKRGCRLNAVYFHAFPYTGEASKQKVVELARILAQAQGGMRLTVVPFAGFQEAARDKASPRHLVLLYRRAMARIAERIAHVESSLALATGENLGQVASQTIPNLHAIESAVDLPMFRPLLTYDKTEIIACARRIGTYDTSVLPYDDCCSLFVPKHPATKARIADLERIEGEMEMTRLLEDAFERREVIDVEA